MLAVVGILAGISALRANPAKEAARATAVTSDIRTIALAAQAYQIEHGKWPRSGGDGTPPADLINYLPGGFPFRGPSYSYQYENVEVAGQPPSVMISVRTTDPALMNRLANTLGHRQDFVSNGSMLSYILSGSFQMGLPESGTIAAPTPP